MSITKHTLLLLVSLFSVSAFLTGNKKPNIVVFISDDLGRWDTSIHGSKDARTPTMEKLAAEGMTFDDAYVTSPSCCPSRFSLLTGLMPARHGAHPNHSRVKTGTKFLPPILKKMGYHIASFGKIAHGNKKFEGLDFNEPKRTDMCVEVEKYFKNNKIEGPICLLVGDRRPHVEWTKEMNFDPKKVTLPSFFIDTKETREHWARYLTDIEGMDQEMGRVLKFAEKKFGKDFIFFLPAITVGNGHSESGISMIMEHGCLCRFAGPVRLKPTSELVPWSVGWIFCPPLLILQEGLYPRVSMVNLSLQFFSERVRVIGK